MSILIKGLEMPKNCAGCPFFVRSDTPKRPFVDCKLIGCLGSVFIAASGILVDCPLVAVPPHGRLIDADAELERLKHCMFPSDMATTIAVGMYEKWLKNATTIIPADLEWQMKNCCCNWPNNEQFGNSE